MREERIKEARRLRELKWSRAQIARKFSVSETTVRRWLDQEFDLVCRAYARRSKQKVRGICIDCGGETRYSGHGGRRTALRCHRCDAKSRRYWTQERVIERIQEWNRLYGRPPTSKEWHIKKGEWPSATSIYGAGSPFRRWNDAIRAAGFEPRESGPGPGRLSWPLEEAYQLSQEGWTYREIAERYGVSVSAISQGMLRNYGPAPNRRTMHVGDLRTTQQKQADLKKALARKESNDGAGADRPRP